MLNLLMLTRQRVVDVELVDVELKEVDDVEVKTKQKIKKKTVMLHRTSYSQFKQLPRQNKKATKNCNYTEQATNGISMFDHGIIANIQDTIG